MFSLRFGQTILKQSYAPHNPFRYSSTALFATLPLRTNSEGLYQFFEQGKALPTGVETGRPWLAPELRMKSFEDLHKLWYVLLKERNIIATQNAELKRLGVNKQQYKNHDRARKCQRSMARIKFVLHERQREFIEARKKVREMNKGKENPAHSET